MNKRQHNKYNMKKTVVQVLVRESTTTSALPNFDPLFNEYVWCNGEIERLRVIQEYDITGFTKDKANLRRGLATVVGDVSRKLVVYYTSTKNNGAKDGIRLSPSDIKKATDAKLNAWALTVLNAAEKDQANLAPFNITAADITNLRTMLEAFLKAMKTPVVSRSDISSATKDLEKVFAKSDEIEAQIDEIVDTIQLTHPTFYETYKSSRKINDMGSRSISFKASAKDSKGNQLSNVTFEILNADETVGLKASGADSEELKPIVSKKTTGKGGFQIKNLPDGTYTALVKKPGFLEKEVQFHVVGGELVNLNVTLEKV